MFDHILVECKKDLVQYNYRPMRQRIIKEMQESVGIVEFQKSMSNSRDSMQFTINVGVTYFELLDDVSSPALRAKTANSQIRQRVGFLSPERLDKWWRLDSTTDLTSVLQDVQECLQQRIVPFIDKYSQIESAISLWRSGRCLGTTDFQRRTYLEDIAKRRGVSS